MVCELSCKAGTPGSEHARMMQALWPVVAPLGPALATQTSPLAVLPWTMLPGKGPGKQCYYYCVYF